MKATNIIFRYRKRGRNTITTCEIKHSKEGNGVLRKAQKQQPSGDRKAY